MSGILALLLLSSPQAAPADFPKDESPCVRVDSAGALPALAFAPDGVLHVAFLQDAKVLLASSPDGGTSFPPPTPVEFPAPVLLLQPPALAVDAQRRVYLGVLAGSPPDLLVRVSKDGGRGFGAPFRLNAAPGSAPRGRVAAAAAAGELLAAWTEERGGRHALYFSRFNDAGKRQGKLIPLSPAVCEDCPPALAADAKGNVLAAWRNLAADPKRGRPLHLAHSSTRGGAFSPAVPASAADSELLDCTREGPAVALHPDGSRFAAAWMDRRPVGDANVFWVSGPPGKPGPDDYVHKDRRYPQGRPALCIDAAGTVWFAWEDSILSSQRIFFSDADRTRYLPIGDPAREDRFGRPALAASGRRVALAYESGDGVAVRILAGP